MSSIETLPAAAVIASIGSMMDIDRIPIAWVRAASVIDQIASA
jgi:hypothetical protein